MDPRASPGAIQIWPPRGLVGEGWDGFMHSYRQLLYHLVFSTRLREPVLASGGRREFFKYVWGIIRNQHGYLYRINAVADHVHILMSIHPSLAVADFVNKIKSSSSKWIKEAQTFPDFNNWQEGYAIFTHSFHEKDRLIEYIIDQEEHHRTTSSLDELRGLLQEAGIEFDEKQLI